MKFHNESLNPEGGKMESRLSKGVCPIHGKQVFVHEKCPFCIPVGKGEENFLPETPKGKRIDTKRWVDYREQQLPKGDRSDVV